MAALDAPGKPGSLFLKLIQRSLWTIIALVLVISLIGIMPISKRQIEGDEAEELGILREVLVLHRHGARTIDHWYDFEGQWPWEDVDLGIGKLTVKGMQQGFGLGQGLQRRYGHWLPGGSKSSSQPGIPDYAVSDSVGAIRVYSTNYDRTVDTANALLLGLLSPMDATPAVRARRCQCRPPHGTRSTPNCVAECLGVHLPEDIPSVDVVHQGTQDDVMRHFGLYQTSECPAWNAWQEKVHSSTWWKHLPGSQFGSAVALVNSMVNGSDVCTKDWPGSEVHDCFSRTSDAYNEMAFLDSVWSNAVCYDADKIPYMPQLGKTNAKIIKTLEPLSEFAWHHAYGGVHGPLAGGIMLHSWITMLQDIAAELAMCQSSNAACRGGAHMSIFSAHDTTVFSLMGALNETHGRHSPHFTSNVVLELWQPEEDSSEVADLVVRILYDGKLLPLKTFGCKKGLCTLQDFTHMALKKKRAYSSCGRT